MAFLFARAPASEPPGLLLGYAEARRQRALAAIRAQAARNLLDSLVARRPAR